MKLSPYFYQLRTAYQAELDDLASDSEGHDVLHKRLAQKRREIGFLVQMMDVAPEMVAVVFHRAFRFTPNALWATLLACHPDEGDVLPEWPSLAPAVALEPWATDIAKAVLSEPTGPRFMAIAAGLEYLHQHGSIGQGAAQGADTDDEALGDAGDDESTPLSADDASDPQSHESQEEARADWLADLGFDRKDGSV